VNSLSIGYRVNRYEEEEGKGNALPVRTATRWEVYEASMVSIPADAGAKVRDGKTDDANTCTIIAAGAPVAAAAAPATTRADEPASSTPAAVPPTKEKPMDRSETIRETDPDAPTPRAATPPEPSEADRAIAVERERCQGIMAGCRTARLPQSFAEKLIADNTSLLEARGMILRELELRNDPSLRTDGKVTPGQVPTELVAGEDHFVHKRKAIENAVLHRVMPKTEKDGPGFELSEDGRRYRGASLMEIGEIFLRAQGRDTRSMSRMDRAAALLSRSQHSTSDFPLLLADVANKALRAAYEAAPQTWRPIARQVSVADFKPGRQLQLGGAPALEEVGEGGEFQHGTIAEAKEQYQLKTYGRIFSITRQALVNDDLSAFAQVPTKFGQSARNLESDLAWAEITSNPAMGDTVQLFNSAHGNLDSVGSVIAIDSIGEARRSLRVQKDLDGATYLNLRASYLIVPAALETVADQFVSQALMAAEPGNINPFAGRLQVISEPRLDADSAIAWYVATSDVPVLYYVLLEGQSGPTVEQEIGFDIDGLKLKCRHDVAFKAADYRAIYKNVGES
jgi:hypothetical protein